MYIMSFRKYGGTNKLEKNNNITVHSIVADTFTIRDAFLSIFTIEGDLQIGGNGIISNNLTVSQQINATTLDISSNATIEGNLYLNASKDVFLRGSGQMIGINKTTPTATLDISSNKVQAFNLKTSTTNNRNIIARNLTNNGLAVVATGTTESGIQFYSANTGTIDISNAQGAMIKYSNTDSLLSLDSTGGDVKVTSKMIITDNTSNGNTHTSFGETVLIYDKNNEGNQPVFFNEAYGNTSVKTGSALTVQSINNASNTFMNITTPNSLGIQIGGGSYPKDPTRSMGVIDVYNPTIDIDATPSIMLVSGNSVTKFNSTTGFNTFQPKYNNYAVDINGPLHLNNGEIKKTFEPTARITELYNYGSNYGIAIGGQGTEENGSYYAYITENGGKSWSRKNPINSSDTQFTIPNNQTFNSVYSYSATRTIVGGTGALAYVTDNAGTNWSQLIITGGINIINAIYTPVDISKNFVYTGGDAGGGNAIVRYGFIESFTFSYGPPTNATALRYKYTDVSYNYQISGGIISDSAGYGQNFLLVGGNTIRKFDLGVSKMDLTLSSTYTNPGAVTYLAVRLADVNNGVAVGGNVISYTKNGGTSWTTANIASLSGKTFNDVYLDSSMNAIVVGNNGYIYSSSDGYYTWKIVDEDVLNASGIGSRITDPTNDITSVFMPDSSTIVLSIVKNNDSDAKAARLYYLNMPNIFNNKQNFLFDVSGCIRMSGDLLISEGGEIKSKNQTFNFVTTDVATLNVATNALYVNMGGTNTTNISLGGANTATILAGGLNTGNVIIGGNVTTSKIGPLNISPLTNGNVTLSNNLVTGNLYANSIQLTNNLDVYNGIVTVRSTNNSTSATTGSLVVYGGLGIVKDIYSTGNINSLSDINLSGNLYSSGNVLVMTSNDNISAITSGNTIIYTSNTGTLQIGGGTAISKNVYIGGTTFCGGDLVIQGQITYLGGEVTTSTTFTSAIVASPLRGNSNSNVDYNYTYRPRDPPTTYNDIGFGAGALTTEGGFAVALDSWLIGNLRVDGINNVITRTVESTSVNTGALQIRGGVGIGGNVYTGGNVIINNTTESNSIVTGALQIRGGVGIGRNLYTGGNVIINSTIESTSTSTGALRITGGVGIGGNVYTGGNIIVNSNIESTSTSSGALQITGGVGIGRNLYTGGNVIINSTIESTSTSTGALRITGGVGIGGNVYTGGNVIINNTTESTSTSSGALQIAGGVGIGRNLYTGGNVIINSTIESTSTSTGALIITGGVGIGGNVYTRGNIIVTSNIESTSTSSGALQIIGGVGIGRNLYTGGNVIINSTIESISTSTGALRITGGVGIGGNVYTGGNVIINSNIESTSTSSGALQITGGVGIGRNLYTGGNVIINSTIESTSTSTGALRITGGVGIGGNVYTGGNVIVNSNIESTSTSSGALQTRGGVGIGRNANIGGNVIVNSTIESTSTNTGALQIIGGVGIGGNINIGGNTNIGKTTIILDTTDSSSVSSGALQVRGGMGVSNKITAGSLATGQINATNLNLSSGSVSENTITGAIIVTGGIGAGGSINVGGNVTIGSNVASTSTSTGALRVTGGVGITGVLYVPTIYTTNLNAETTIFTGTDESTSAVTGALKLGGGMGIAKNLNVGGGSTIVGVLNVSGISTLTTTTIVGSLNVTGGPLIVSGGTTLNGILNVIGGTTLSGGLLVTAGSTILSNTTVTGILRVVGGTTLSGGLAVLTGTTLSGGLLVTDGSSILSNTTVTGTLRVIGGTTLSGGLAVSTGTTLSGGLLVTSGSTILSNTTVTGTLNAVGGTTLSGGLAVSTGTTLSGGVLVTSGSTIISNTTVTGTLNAVGGTTLSGGLAVSTGTTLSGGLLVTAGSTILSNTTVTGTLRVLGGTTLSGGLAVSTGTTLSGGLLVTAGSTILSNTTVNGTLNAVGGTTLSGGLLVTAGSTILSNTTVTGTLNAVGGTTLSGGLAVSIGTTLSGGLLVTAGSTILSNTTVTGTLNAVGGTTLSGGLAVSTGTTLSGGLLVTAGSTILSNTTVTGTLRVVGGTTLSGGLSVTGGQTVFADTTITGSLNVTGKIFSNGIPQIYQIPSVDTLNNTNWRLGSFTAPSAGCRIHIKLYIHNGVTGSANGAEDCIYNINAKFGSASPYFEAWHTHEGPNSLDIQPIWSPGNSALTASNGTVSLFMTIPNSNAVIQNSFYIVTLSTAIGCSWIDSQIGAGPGTSQVTSFEAPNITHTTSESTSTSTGALQVLGGVGIAKRLNVGGLVTANAGLTVNTSLLYTGTDLIFWNAARGGNTAQTGSLGLAMVHEAGNNLVINSAGTSGFSGGVEVRGGIGSINTSTGSFRVVGGVGISGNLNVGGLSNTITASGTNNGTNIQAINGGFNAINADINCNNFINSNTGGLTWIQGPCRFANNGDASQVEINNTNGLSVTGIVQLTSGIQATSTVSGALRIAGGIGMTGNIFAGGTLRVGTGGITVLATTSASSSTSTGSVRIIGGLGVSGNIFAGAMVTAPFFNASSDKRIKKDITDLNCPSLEIMRKIRPREYTMIDGSKESVYGFIAQEVKEIIPKSIYIRKGYIPSVYENAFVDGTKITLINKTTSDISCCKLKLRDKNNEDIIVNVTSIHDNNTFSINADIGRSTIHMDICGTVLDKYIQNGATIYMRGSQVYTGEVKQGIFVYGIQVDDFHSINKDTIWTITLSATQEMDVQLQEARQTIRTLEERISAIEKRLS